MSYFSTTLLLALVFATLSGCGQTGPLYMPTEEPPPAVPAASGAVAPQPQAAP